MLAIEEHGQTFWKRASHEANKIQFYLLQFLNVEAAVSNTENVSS